MIIYAIEGHDEIIHDECERGECTETQQHDCDPAMFEKGVRTKRMQRQVPEDPEDEEDMSTNQLVCNMIGQQCEQLPFPVIIDSGACASVMPTTWCDQVPLTKIPHSEAGEFFRSASGQRIYNHGQKTISIMTKEGSKRDMKFTVCEVSKALGSVSQICRAGHRVVFNPPWVGGGPYIQHIEIGERLWFEQYNGLYALNTRVAPVHKQSSVMKRPPNEQDFGWPGHP